MDEVHLRTEGGLNYVGPSAGLVSPYLDVVLRTGDGSIEANRVVLAAGCSVMRRCLPQRMEDEMVQVLLPEHSCAEVGALLEVLYGRTEQVELGHVEGVMNDLGFAWGRPDYVSEVVAGVKMEKEEEEDTFDYGSENPWDNFGGDPWGTGDDGEEWMEPEVELKAPEEKPGPKRKKKSSYDDSNGFVKSEDCDAPLWSGSDDDYMPAKRSRRKPGSGSSGTRKARRRPAASKAEEEDRLLRDCASTFSCGEDGQPFALKASPGDPSQFGCAVAGCEFSHADKVKVFHHMGEEHRAFACQHCGAYDECQDALRKHLRVLHPDLPHLICKLCSRLFADDDSYLDHVAVHALEFDTHPEDLRYVCPETACAFRHEDPGAVGTHLTWRHNKRFCPHCAGYIAIGDEFRSHLATHSHLSRAVCGACPRTFRTQRDTDRHWKEVHNPESLAVARDPVSSERVLCPFTECGSSHPDRFQMVRHMLEDHQKLVCPFCAQDLKSTSPDQLTAHTSKCHAVLGKTCERCFKSFPNQKELSAHSKEVHGHVIKPTEMCHQCGQTFTHANCVKRHLLRCKGKNPDRRPANRNEVEYKIDFVKDQMNSCPHEGCDYQSDKYHKLRRHYKQHMRRECPYCHKMYSYYSYAVHVAVEHTKETHLQCEKCPERFYNKTLLREHMEAVHIAEPIHVCDICGERFLTSRARVVHRSEKHMRKRQYPCPVCGANFRSSTLINPHILQAHPALAHLAVTQDKKYIVQKS